MNKSNFAQLIPFKFSEKLILALDSKWYNYFLDENITFSVSIKNNHLMLVSPKISIRPTNKNTAIPTGDVSNDK